MSVSYAPKQVCVPPGFENILEGLAREILRAQPDNVIDFAAEYFKRKIELKNSELSVLLLRVKTVRRIMSLSS